MSIGKELGQLERDFVSGRNPLAFLPLCQELRRRREFARALEFCQRGLRANPGSVAGGVLHARLLTDLGRYEEALKEIGRVEKEAPDAMGLLVEKVRCLTLLGRLEEARPVLETIERRNPMDTGVQQVRGLFRDADARERHESLSSSRAVPKLDEEEKTEVEGPISRASRGVKRLAAPSALLAAIQRELRPLGVLRSCAVVPLSAAAPAVEGEVADAEAAVEFYKGASVACKDLEMGQPQFGFLETDNAQLIVLVREGNLVSVSFPMTGNYGRMLHRLLDVVSQYVPGMPPR